MEFAAGMYGGAERGSGSPGDRPFTWGPESTLGTVAELTELEHPQLASAATESSACLLTSYEVIEAFCLGTVLHACK